MHFQKKIGLAAALVMISVASAYADEVSDALQSASDAYAAGDLGKTSEAIVMARQALAKQQSDLLTALLPEAPEGFTRTLSEDFSQGFAMAGGGSGAEARYDSADGATSFTLSFVADNPMVASMAAMLGNAQMMAMMGTVVKVGDTPLLQTDGNVSGLLDSRVLFQAQGAGVDAMMPLIQQIDFAKVASFDKK